MSSAIEPAIRADGPPTGLTFSHISVPCRNLAEGREFYTRVLGATVQIDWPDFIGFRLFGVPVGIAVNGASFISRDGEYPHFAFFAKADELLQLKAWLTRCGIPSSNFWTRGEVEALMFFRDPSGNLIEITCEHGFADADKLPRGPARGHGTAVDITALYYREWRVPNA